MLRKPCNGRLEAWAAATILLTSLGRLRSPTLRGSLRSHLRVRALVRQAKPIPHAEEAVQRPSRSMGRGNDPSYVARPIEKPDPSRLATLAPQGEGVGAASKTNPSC